MWSKVKDFNSEICLEDARKIQPNIEIDNEIKDILPTIGFCRSMVQAARQ